MVENKSSYKVKKQKNHILRQFLPTYLIVFLVPLLICSIYFFRIIGMLETDDFDMRQKELEHASDQMDSMIDDFESIGNTLTTNNYVNQMKYKGTEVWQSPDSYRLNELRDALPKIGLINQNVDHYFIFFDKSDLVINDKDIYTWEDFYDLYLREEGFASFEEWKAYMLENAVVSGVNPEKNYTYRKTGEKKLFCFAKPLLTSDVATRSSIWILFDRSSIENRMPALDENSIQYIKNAAGEVIYYAAGENVKENQEKVLDLAGKAAGEDGRKAANLKIDGKSYHLMSTASDTFGFSYSVLYADNVLKERMLSVFRIAFLIIIFSILAGIWLSYLMSRKTVVPINEILGEIARITEKGEDHQPVFTSLKNNFAYLVKQNSDLSAVIESQKPYLKSAFLLRLLLGDISTEEEAEKRAEYVGLEHRGKEFILFLFSFEIPWDTMEPELVTTCTLSLTEAMEKELPGSFSTNLGSNQTVLVMAVNTDKKDTFRQQMEEHVECMKKQMPSEIASHLFVFGSEAVDHLTELSEAYRNSMGLEQYGIEKLEKTIYWQQAGGRGRKIYPSGALEVRLVSCVFSGDQSALHDELEQLMKKWVLGTSMSSYLQQMLFSELQLIFLRMLEKIDAEEEELRPFYERLEKNQGEPLINQIHITLNLYRELCSFISDRRQAQDADGLVTEVIKLIYMNYADSTLSLTQAASLYSVSESYLSTVFKNIQGTKFSCYVEDVRIEKAKELLENTDLTVKDIAEKTGYTSANSFCRAFRRVTGMNTSEYRKK